MKRTSDTITAPEAARRLGVSANTLYESMKRGEIPYIPLGKRKVIPREAFERLLKYGKAALLPPAEVDVAHIVAEYRRQEAREQLETLQRRAGVV